MSYSQNTRRIYNRAWDRARAKFLAENPYCQACNAPAKAVDHIIPHRGDPRLFWDKKNWQALCLSCHNRKTAGGG